ncbi:MAG: hypothetical protein CL681_13835 [Blastopirellula sp.]|nr:hypothetical protein [Blastopirellula sp.]
MASKFVPLDEAAEQLGISPDKLVEMRSNGEIHGYRDGGSWKFKAEEIERVAAELGTPQSSGSVDDSLSDLFGSDSIELGETDPAGSSVLISSESELPLDRPSSTVIGQSGSAELGADSDLRLIPDEDSGDVSLVPSESRSNTELGDLPGPNDEASSALLSGDDLASDGDLLVAEDDVDSDELNLSVDDALASDDGLSDIEAGSDGLALAASDAGPGPDSSGIRSGDLDLQLSDDSSGIDDLGTDKLTLSEGTGGLSTGSDALELSSGSGSGDLELISGSESGELELSLGSGTGDLEEISGSEDLELGGDELALEEDDDLVLGGSDLAMTGDSGINLGSPTDSGLSLEEEPLEVASSASALELPEDDDEIIALDDDLGSEEATQLKQDEEFLLSPVDEMAGDEFDESDSGSQVIALEDSQAFDTEGATMVQSEEAALVAEDDGVVGFEEAQPAGAGAGMDPAMSPQPAGQMMMAAEPRQAPYSIWNVLGLLGCVMMLSVTGVIMVDVLTNMWVWDSGSTSTSLTDAVVSMLGMK